MAGRGPVRRASVGRARRRTAGALAVVLVASGLGYVAVASQGSTVHEAALNDSGVWVSSDTQAKFARANVPIGPASTPAWPPRSPRAAGSTCCRTARPSSAWARAPASSSRSTRAPPRPATPPPASPPNHPRPAPSPRPRSTCGQPDRPARPRERQGLRAAGRHAGRHPRPGRLTGREAGRDHRQGRRGRRRRRVAPCTRSAAPTARSPPVPAQGERFAKPTVIATDLRTQRPDLTAVGGTWVAYDAAKDHRLHAQPSPRASTRR